MIEEPAKLTVHQRRNRPSAQQIAAFQGVPTSFVVDAMFGKGALLSHIRPLALGADPVQPVAGPALTARNGAGDILATLGALAFLQNGDILVAGVEGHQICAAAGDRVAGMAKNAGAQGFLTDGPMRDYDGIRAVGLPCWCTGLCPASPFTTGPGEVGGPLTLAGQQIASGDMIIADIDGVVVVPFDQIDAVLTRLDAVKEAEAQLDALVQEGLAVPPAIQDLLDSDETQYRTG